MKRLIAILACLSIMSLSALPVAAQTRDRCTNRRTIQNTRYSRYDRNNEVYRAGRYRNDDYRYEDGYRYGRDRSVWERSRDKITTAGGAAGGAVLGGLIGGKKGAIIGAITGGAGAAIYTYKIRNTDRRF